jgi:hypothetical protein
VTELEPAEEQSLPARMSEIRELAARAVQQAQDMRRLAQRTWRAAVHSERLNAEIAAKLRADPELREAIEMAEAEPVGHLTPEEI